MRESVSANSIVAGARLGTFWLMAGGLVSSGWLKLAERSVLDGITVAQITFNQKEISHEGYPIN